MQNYKRKISNSTIITAVLIVLVIALFIAVIIKDRADENGTPGTQNGTLSSGSSNSGGDNNGQNKPPANSTPAPEPVWHEQAEQDVKPTSYTVSYTPPANVEIPYYIKVNRAMCTVTVYGIDENGAYSIPVRAFVCSVGKAGDETIEGEYAIHEPFGTTWCYMVDGTYSQYAYRIHNGYMFHVVPYFTTDKSSLETEEYNKLGTPASLGCVRLSTADAKWIYDNCVVGTKVLIYDDTENPGPLGKPNAIKIPVGHEYAGWDPTDPDEQNPWNAFSPRIEASDITVSAGTEIDILQDVRAFDTCGNDISGSIYWYGKYTTDLEGSYSVTYAVIDAIGRSAEKTVTIHVTPYEENSKPAAAKVSYYAVIEDDNIQTDVKSEFALFLSRDDGSVLLDKKSTQRIYPASIVKIMTLLVSLENLTDMNERLVITQETYDALVRRDASMSKLPIGVPIKVIDLLHGSFMPSGADASVTLANRIAGSESAFAELMNQKAAAIGMTDTHYVNATGLDEDGQYTTCSDIAKLLDYALNNAMFRQIFTTTSYTTEAFDTEPNGVTLRSTMFNALPTSEFESGIHILGGKTGYTDNAGLCLASIAKSNKTENEYILVTMKAPGSYWDEPYPSHVGDAVTVYGNVHEYKKN